MAEALGVADDTRAEHLHGVVFRNASGDHAAAGVLAVELNDHIGLGALTAVGEKALGNDDVRILAADDARIAPRGVDAADLTHVHLYRRALFKIDDRRGVHNVFAVAVALAVVLLNVLDAGVFADVERMHAVVLGGVRAAVVDAAAGDDRDVRALADVKIVVHRFAQARLRDDDRDMAAVLAAGDKTDIDAGLIGFRGDGDVFGVDAPGAAGVLADIECALGLAVLHAGNDFQKRRIDAVELAHFFASP